MNANGRTRPQAVAAGILAYDGAVAIFYAGFLPFTPFSDVPVPLAMSALGVASLAAAAGVFRGQAWGRALGVGLTIAGLAQGVLRFADQAPRSGSLPEALAYLVVNVAIGGCLLWLLLRRWPKRPQALAR
jgi:hypothetical protein